MKLVKWCVCMLGVLSALWLGLVRGVPGLVNIGMFAVWVMAIVELMVAIAPQGKELLRGTRRVAPGWLTMLAHFAIMMMLLWFGNILTAMVLLIGFVMKEGQVIAFEKERAA